MLSNSSGNTDQQPQMSRHFNERVTNQNISIGLLFVYQTLMGGKQVLYHICCCLRLYVCLEVTSIRIFRL